MMRPFKFIMFDDTGKKVGKVSDRDPEKLRIKANSIFEKLM